MKFMISFSQVSGSFTISKLIKKPKVRQSTACENKCRKLNWKTTGLVGAVELFLWLPHRVSALLSCSHFRTSFKLFWPEILSPSLSLPPSIRPLPSQPPPPSQPTFPRACLREAHLFTCTDKNTAYYTEHKEAYRYNYMIKHMHGISATPLYYCLAVWEKF